MEISTNEFGNFIERFKDFEKRNMHYKIKNDISRFSSILSGFSSLASLQSKFESFYASNFNIFKILKIHKYEVITHSPFLANLLDIHGTHHQGNLFYKNFLEIINPFPQELKVNDFIPPEHKFDSLWLETEKIIIGGRLDILIQNYDSQNRFAIVIENKIGTGEHDEQLTTYYDFLTKNFEKFLLIYLTISGNENSSLSKENKGFIQISYSKHIVDFLEHVIPFIKAETVKYTVKQYLNLVKEL